MPCRCNEGVADAFHCCNSLLRTFSDFVKLVPLSETKWVVPGRRAEKRVMALRSESASILKTSSTCTEQVLMHAHTMAQTLWEALPFILTAKGPIMSRPVSLDGDCRFVLIGCKGAICCSAGFLKAFWHATQVLRTDLTSWSPCMTQACCRACDQQCFWPA